MFDQHGQAIEFAVHARGSAAEQHAVKALGLDVSLDFIQGQCQHGNYLNHGSEVAPLFRGLGGKRLYVEAAADVLLVKIDANLTGHAAYLPFTVCTAFRAAAVPD